MVAPSKTYRVSSPWVGHRIGRTLWPLTCVHGFDSLIARLCASEKLSLER